LKVLPVTILNNMKTRLILLLFIGTLLPAAIRSAGVASLKLTEEEKITKLIEYIRNLKGATFIRNGSNHTPEEAADHLALKRKKAGKRVQTAVQFILYCASKSSTTGKDYLVKMPDGKTLKCIDVMVAELKKIEAADKG
jgi:hypothetical protein